MKLPLGGFTGLYVADARKTLETASNPDAVPLVADALALIDVRVLDHVLVTRNATVSFAERGLL